jgi:ubiquinone biosynthesis protein
VEEHSKPLYLEMIKELRALLTEQQASALLALMLQKNVAAGEREAVIQNITDAVDWDSHREQLGQLVSKILPIEQLVPDIYADWRPIIRDSVTFIGARLSSARLIPKLIEQLMLPDDISLEQRLISFIEQMPSLQKLGQIIARNRNLNPEFRAELTRLENEIRDISPGRVKTEIEQRLGPILETYKVKIERLIHAEASVCALMRFTWMDSNTKQQGVFKVLKPHIKEFFTEEMELLQGLADFFDAKREDHVLAEVNLRGVFEDIRSLLEQELDSVNEQVNLKNAYTRYKSVSGVRIPGLIEEFSAPGVIAMTFEKGTKVTEAFSKKTSHRKELSCRMVEALIAIPLFAAEEESFFHADPHAGNLFVDEDSRELVIFDWALTERLNREQRRKIILLISAVMLRDEALIYNAITELSKDDFTEDATRIETVRNQISQFINELSVYGLPGINDVLSLLDELLLTGVNFSTPLLIFRKVLLTLDGVLHDVADEVSIDSVLTRYVLENWTNELCGMNLLTQARPNFQLPLSNTDALSLAWSAQSYCFRTGIQTSEQMLKLFY